MSPVYPRPAGDTRLIQVAGHYHEPQMGWWAQWAGGLLTWLPFLNFPRLTGGYSPPHGMFQEEGPGKGNPAQASGGGPGLHPLSSQGPPVLSPPAPVPGLFCCLVGQGSPLLCIGRHHHRQCPLQGLHHAGGTPGSRLQPGPSRHHQLVRHRWGWQPHGRQHLPQRVGRPAGGAGEGRWVSGQSWLGGESGGGWGAARRPQHLPRYWWQWDRQDEGRRGDAAWLLAGGVGLAQPKVRRPWAAAEAVGWVWLVVRSVFEPEPLEPSIRDPQAGWTAVPG